MSVSLITLFERFIPTFGDGNRPQSSIRYADLVQHEKGHEWSKLDTDQQARFSRDRPLFTDTLDMIKFLCKDIWTLTFRKQIDNLKTNHRVSLWSTTTPLPGVFWLLQPNTSSLWDFTKPLSCSPDNLRICSSSLLIILS